MLRREGDYPTTRFGIASLWCFEGRGEWSGPTLYTSFDIDLKYFNTNDNDLDFQ